MNESEAFRLAPGEGDLEEFAALFEQHRDRLLRVCIRRVHDASLAEDIVQDTFLRAYDNLSRFQTDRKLWPWLVAIASHLCCDAKRATGRVSTTDDHEGLLSHEWQQRQEIDAPFEYALNQERKRHIEVALEDLSARQRRVLLLHAEGWKYTDIAQSESISIDAVKAMLYRSRNRIRWRLQGAPLGLVPGLWLRGIRERILNRSMRFHIQMEACTRFAYSSVEQMGFAVLALVVGVVGLQSGPIEAASSAPQLKSFSNQGSAPHRETMTSPQGSSGVTLINLTQNGLNPRRNATPEDTHFTSVESSPDYRNDHSVFAAGEVEGCVVSRCPVLFVTHDGGADWHQLASDSFQGRTLLLPPAFPRDSRIFAVGDVGLQESDDSGQTFNTILPGVRTAALPPDFGLSDPKILVETHGVISTFDTQTKRVFPLVGPSSINTDAPSMVYPSDYKRSGKVILGSYANQPVIGPSTNLASRPVVESCRHVCSTSFLPLGDNPKVRAGGAPERPVTVAFSALDVFLSLDDGLHFRELSVPDVHPYAQVADVALGPPTEGGFPMVYAAVDTGWIEEGKTPAPNGLYVWSPSGGAWKFHTIRLPGYGFRMGPGPITVTTTGKIFAAGGYLGLGCSADAGISWRVRCTDGS